MPLEPVRRGSEDAVKVLGARERMTLVREAHVPGRAADGAQARHPSPETCADSAIRSCFDLATRELGSLMIAAES